MGMKFKLSVLTLLVLGLIFAGSAFAADRLVVELDAQNEAALSISEAAALNGIPMLRMKITNEYSLTREITDIVLTAGTNTVGVGAAAAALVGTEFAVQITQDVNANGIIDAGDTVLAASIGATGLTAPAATQSVALAANTLSIAANSSKWIIVSANVALGAAAGDKLEIIWDDATSTGMIVENELGAVMTVGSGPTLLTLADASADPLKNAGTDTNVPNILMADPGVTSAVTIASTTMPVAARSIGNKAQNEAVVGFKLTSDAIFSNVVDSIVLEDGGSTASGDVEDDVGSAYLYRDMGTIGKKDALDILVSTIADLGAYGVTSTFVLDNSTVAKAPVYINKSASVDFLVVMNLTGTAGKEDVPGADDAATQEVLAIDVAAASTINGGDTITGGPYLGLEINMVPLYITKVETTDFDSDGLLDALKVTFSDAVNDSRWSSLSLGTDIIVTDSANAAGTITELSFSSTVSGDVANNTVIYVQFAGMTSSDRFTNGLPRFLIAADNTVWNVSGNKSLKLFGSGIQGVGATATVDKASPVATGAYTGDVDGDGKIDKITVSFSEDMDTDNAKSYTGVKFASTISTFGSSGLYTPTSGSVSGSAIVYTIPQSGSGVYDTEATPSFNYNPAATSSALADLAGNEVKLYGAGGLTQQTATADEAAPVIVKATTMDTYTDEHESGATGFEAKVPNGKIDTVVLTFSEKIKTSSGIDTAAEIDLMIAQFAVKHSGVVNNNVTKKTAVGATTVAPFKPAPVIASTGTYGSSDTNTMVTIYVVEQASSTVGMMNGGDTGITFDVDYALGAAADQITDTASTPNALTVFTGVAPAGTLVDAAKPFIVDGLFQRDGTTPKITITVEALPITTAMITEQGGWLAKKFSNILTVDSDAVTKGSDTANGDGYIDAFDIYFSESVHAADAAAIAAGFEVTNATGNSTITLDVGVDADGSGIIDTTDDNLAFTNAVFMGTSSKVAGKYDTAATPTVKLTGGVTIYDGVDAIYKAADDNMLAASVALTSYDTAKPVPVSAIGSVGQKTIVVKWSETVYSASDGTGDFSATPANSVFGYHDVDSAGAGDFAATNIAYASQAMTLTTDATLSVVDVEGDSIWIKTDDKVFDNADADAELVATLTYNKAESLTSGVGLKIIINDIIAPTITSATTLDVDGNGFVDHIKFVFSEDMDDTKLTSYYAINTVTNNSAEQWILSGYTGYARFNLYENTDIGRAAAFAKGAPVFTDNNPNDNILYLQLRENEVPLSSIGTTGWAPELTFSGVTLADKKPNVLDTSAPVQVVDGVGPVAMTARTLTVTTLEVAFSEEINLTTVNSGDFDWTLGEALEGFQKYIAALSQPEPGVIVLETIEGYKWEPYMGGTIKYIEHLTDATKKGIFDLQVTSKGVPTTSGVYSGTKAYANVEWYSDADGTVDATAGKTAASLTISTADIVVEVEEAAVPTAYALSENYPNPFNPTTTIEFAIPVAGNVELVIYNINGQKVRTLVNETKDAGFFHMTWDGRNDLGETVSSGIYLYRLVSGNFNKMEKMTFIK